MICVKFKNEKFSRFEQRFHIKEGKNYYNRWENVSLRNFFLLRYLKAVEIWEQFVFYVTGGNFQLETNLVDEKCLKNRIGR